MNTNVGELVYNIIDPLVIKKEEFHVLCSEINGINYIHVMVHERDLENVRGKDNRTKDAIKQICCSIANCPHDMLKVFIKKIPRYCSKSKN